jgi:hypothetical protein
MDPFLGIGASAVAAAQCGANAFIGFELDPEYLNIATPSAECLEDDLPYSTVQGYFYIWSRDVRLYRPRAEILNGTWKFPEAQPVSIDAEGGVFVTYYGQQSLKEYPPITTRHARPLHATEYQEVRRVRPQ